MDIKRNVSIDSLTTFKVGGTAEHFVEVENKDELVEAVKFAKENSLEIFVLGGGSDILVSDEGFDGLVLRYSGKSLDFKEDKDTVLVKSEAGLSWDRLVEETVDRGLQGIEAMSGIPGSVGASPIQNIGAYGQELKDSFVELTAYDLKEEEFKKFSKEDCDFGYRESIFKKPENKRRYVITDITLRLNKDKAPEVKYDSLKSYLEKKGIKKPSLKELREAVLDVRGQKLEDPEVIGNAGSFFKNPIVDPEKAKELKKGFPDMPSYEVEGGVKLFSGWLIEEAGWKGKKHKNAEVSSKNALVITNPGGASAKDIKELSEKISDDVFDKFGIKLEPEVQFIGFD